MPKPYRVVECDVNTGEIIGTRWDGTREQCVAYLRRRSAPTNHSRCFTLELQHPDGRIVSWWA